MGWLRDRLARLGVRGPVGRDTVAAAVLAMLGLARTLAALAVNGGRLPVPTWEVAAANLASTADFATIALRRQAPPDGPRPGHGGRGRRRRPAVVYAYEHGVVTPGDDSTGPRPTR